MFLLVLLGLATTSFALPALELPTRPEALVITPSEAELDRNIPNNENPFINNNEQNVEIVVRRPIRDEINEEERRLFEEERRIIEEEKRIIEEEKRMLEEKRMIEEETSKIIAEEKRIIEEEEQMIIAEEEKRLIEQETRLNEEERKIMEEEVERKIMEEEVERKIVLPALPSPPELPPLDESMFASFLQAEKDSQDPSKDAKPFIFMWKLPRIRFPGRYIVDNIFGPHITLGV